MSNYFTLSTFKIFKSLKDREREREREAGVGDQGVGVDVNVWLVLWAALLQVAYINL